MGQAFSFIFFKKKKKKKKMGSSLFQFVFGQNINILCKQLDINFPAKRDTHKRKVKTKTNLDDSKNNVKV